MRLEKQLDFDSAIRRFESSRPSQPVRSLKLFADQCSKWPRLRAVRVKWRSLGVSDSATNAPLAPAVSEGYFWRLVF
jgi:hypothetical protein